MPVLQQVVCCITSLSVYIVEFPVIVVLSLFTLLPVRRIMMNISDFRFYPDSRSIKSTQFQRHDDTMLVLFVYLSCFTFSLFTGICVHRCKKTFFYVFNVFFYFPNVFYLKKTLAKFRAASRLTRSTFKITATKYTYDFSVACRILKISLLA